MKLNISNNKKQINNYVNMSIKENNIDLSKIVNNSCEEILLIDSLDSVEYEHINEILMHVCSKLRLNGRLVIVGIDIKSMSRQVMSEEVSIEDYNKVLSQVKSLNSLSRIQQRLPQYGLYVESSVLKGYKYEIVLIRKQNENQI